VVGEVRSAVDVERHERRIREAPAADDVVPPLVREQEPVGGLVTEDGVQRERSSHEEERSRPRERVVQRHRHRDDAEGLNPDADDREHVAPVGDPAQLRPDLGPRHPGRREALGWQDVGKKLGLREHGGGRHGHAPSITVPAHMTQPRNEGDQQQRTPLTARSVIASTLLGVDPPRLPGNVLVRSGELFGIAEGTTRVALSRMVAAGELRSEDGAYHLTGRLLERQARQAASRAAATSRWDGGWRMAVVTAERRPAAERAELRDAMRDLRMAEVREGVWLRPDNLPARPLPDVAGRCLWLGATPDEPAALAASLWDLRGWARHATRLRAEMDDVLPELDAGRTDALAPAFVLSAAVLRHFQADPLLPAELLPDGWPGAALRAEYDRYDAAFLTVWRTWFRSMPT
jgi:phenylacetic acid degradation operon negative regulatory protein